jgi:hypothetical protein
MRETKFGNMYEIGIDLVNKGYLLLHSCNAVIYLKNNPSDDECPLTAVIKDGPPYLKDIPSEVIGYPIMEKIISERKSLLKILENEFSEIGIRDLATLHAVLSSAPKGHEILLCEIHIFSDFDSNSCVLVGSDDFIAAMPDLVRSLERTSEKIKEQIFTKKKV